MDSSNTTTPGQRLVSLDVFRGITIAGMILVNNPGSWKYVYGPLQHAPWHGWTPTDLVFPFFLFIVGVAMTFSFRRRLEQGDSRPALLVQVVRRTVILFLLGLIMAGYPDPTVLNRTAGQPTGGLFFMPAAFRLIVPYVLLCAGVVLLFRDQPVLKFGPSTAIVIRKAVASTLLAAAAVYFIVDWQHFQESKLRLPGVLQRIAVCYFFASLIVLTGGLWWRAAWGASLLAGYYAIVTYMHPPSDFTAQVEGPEGLLHEWIDVRVLGAHLYTQRPDPEGLLSTLPAIGTVLAGVLTGHWLQTPREKIDKLIGLFLAANVALVLGLWSSWVFPINKKIWTSSYVLATAGVALHFLAVCYWLIDVRGRRRWAWPFVVFGSNAIVMYFASSVTAKVIALYRLSDPVAGSVTLKGWIYEHLLASWAGPWNGSLAYPILYLLLWLPPMYLLYRYRVFVRI